MAEFTGEIHPAAAVWPMLSEPDLRRLADDIAAEGLRHPIVIDAEGRILDGRNRLAACQIAGIEPQFETFDGDPVALVLSENNERRHITTGQRAMATALTLATNGKRSNGRWQRGSVPADTRDSTSTAWADSMAKAGVVIDHAPSDEAAQVVLDELTLDAAYKIARDNEKAKARRTELPDDLGALVDAGELSLDEALRRSLLPDDYATRVANGQLSLDEAEQLAQQAERERADAVRRQADWLADFLRGWDAFAHLGANPLRPEVLNALSDHDRERLLAIEKEVSR